MMNPFMKPSYEILIELNELGFGNVQIAADFMTVEARTYCKDDGVYVKSICGSIEMALWELTVLAKMYNNFNDETKAMIQRQQAEDKLHDNL